MLKGIGLQCQILLSVVRGCVKGIDKEWWVIVLAVDSVIELSVVSID